MAQFHFVEDYERYVSELMRAHPIDEAMSLAVGGSYDEIGNIEAEIIKACGVDPKSTVVDLGCGSGRLASVLGKGYPEISYMGLDVVQNLLDYALTRCPKNFEFILNRNLSIPLPDCYADIFVSFSVFTHLLHAETFIYLQEAFRILKPSGKVIMSFLEFSDPAHWSVFEQTVETQKRSETPVLNTFIERSVIGAWCNHLGFQVVEFAGGWEGIGGAPPLGQSVAVLQKPA